MNEREQALLEDANEVIAQWAEWSKNATHHRECWKSHVSCFAERVKARLED
ncbi:hypothetical protein ACI7YT_12270 [Microbacterium sp. M]|uniref:hypothetical protein n=1 Tax=Microbacterium sp. M TaxID=3377125 RepID=UPI00386CA385